MTLIDLLPPQQRRDLRRLRKRIAKRQYMRRVREERKLLCVGVDLPIDAGTCGRFVHAGYQRCIHCTRRRWWLLTARLQPCGGLHRRDARRARSSQRRSLRRPAVAAHPRLQRCGGLLRRDARTPRG